MKTEKQKYLKKLCQELGEQIREIDETKADYESEAKA